MCGVWSFCVNGKLGDTQNKQEIIFHSLDVMSYERGFALKCQALDVFGTVTHTFSPENELVNFYRNAVNCFNLVYDGIRSTKLSFAHSEPKFGEQN
jgi:hypothetical protein